MRAERKFPFSMELSMVKSKKEVYFWKPPCSGDRFESVQIPHKQLAVHDFLTKLNTINCCSKRSQQCKISSVDGRYLVLRGIERFQWIQNYYEVFLNHYYYRVFAFLMKKWYFFHFFCEILPKVDKIPLTIDRIKK